jgi:hypothetical protein
MYIYRWGPIRIIERSWWAKQYLAVSLNSSLKPSPLRRKRASLPPLRGAYIWIHVYIYIYVHMYVYILHVYTNVYFFSVFLYTYELMKPKYSICVHYLCLIGRVFVFYVGHVDKSSLYETLFYCNILSKHHHHQIQYML